MCSVIKEHDLYACVSFIKPTYGMSLSHFTQKQAVHFVYKFKIGTSLLA